MAPCAQLSTHIMNFFGVKRWHSRIDFDESTFRWPSCEIYAGQEDIATLESSMGASGSRNLGRGQGACSCSLPHQYAFQSVLRSARWPFVSSSRHPRLRGDRSARPDRTPRERGGLSPHCPHVCALFSNGPRTGLRDERQLAAGFAAGSRPLKLGTEGSSSLVPNGIRPSAGSEMAARRGTHWLRHNES